MALDIVAQDLIIDETTGLQDDDVSVTNTTVNYLLGLDSAGGLTSPEVAFQSNFVVASASAGETINSVILAQDASGTPFSTTVGVNSGIQTVDGDYVWLFKDPTHANVVIGVIGTSDPAAEPLETGPLAFSFALINTSNTNADLYTVQYVPLLHNSPGDGTLNTYDERIDLANKVFASVTATTVLNFSQLGDAPPGHNNWYILDADVASTQKILVTAHDTGVQSEVNVSTQGLGVASQDVRFGRELQIDLINGGTQSAGKNFTDAPIAPNYDSHVENVSNAGFSISQSTPTNTKADIEVHAYNNDDNAEGAALPGDDNDTEINITAVTFKLNGVTTTAAALGITVDLSGTGMILRNVGEGVTVDFTTAGGVGGTFDRFTIKNIDADKDYFDVKEVHYGSDVASAYQEEVGSFINFDDDGPTIDPSAAVVPTLTTDDTAIPDSDGPTSFADLFTSAFGADGFKDADDNNVEDADAISYALSVSSAGVDSGLVDTISGDKIYLFLQGGVVNGRVGLDNDAGSNAAGAVAFSISVNADTGAVTLTQNNSVVHNDPNDPVETGLSAAGMSAVLVKLTATITDGDGDTDSATRDIGNAFKFEDDGPTIDPSAAVVPTLTTDDTAIPDSDGPTSFAGLFTNAAFGTDGFKDADDNNVEDADAISYALSVSSAGVDSGLVDTISGDKIYLFLQGGVVNGRVGLDNDAGSNAAGAVAFSISVNADTGAVTLTQNNSVVHNDPNDPVETGLSAAGMSAVLVKLTATITDGDGDTDSATRDIGNAFKFEDDGPTIDPSAAVVPTLTTDDTAIPDSDGPTSFADLFTSAFGADGFKDADDNNVEDADAISYALSVSSAGVDSGLVDTISGDKIYLFLQGGVVNGRVGLDNDAGSNAAGAVAFSISVNADTGAVTLTQNNSVVHNDPNDPVETGLSAAGMSAVLVKLTATITDGDGDTDTATRNIGDAFKFEDDGPSAPIVTVSTAVIEDETSGVNATPDPHDADDTGDAAVVALFSVLPAGTTLSFAKSSAPLVTLSGGGFGRDGPAAVDDVTYALSVVDGTASSLSTTEGTQIFLYNGTGVLEGLILGRVGNELPGGDTANASGAIAFALAVDDDGFGYIAHRMAINSGPGGSLPADFDNVVAIAGGAVQIAVTYTDGDGDHATTASTNIGTLFTFQDDGPVITEPSSAGTPATAAHLGNEAGQSAIGDFEYDIGSDNHSAAFYTAGGSDFVDANGGVAGVQLSLSGTVSGPPSSAITNTNVTLFSEDADSAVFDFSFDYDKDPINAGVQTGTATGTLTFDKDAGTFTLEMGTPVEGFSFNILHTSDLLAKQPVGNTGHPQIVVERLAVDDPNTTIDEDFYVQFTANTKTGGKHPIGFGFNSTGEGATVGDNVFNNDGATHDLITNLHEDWVSATQTTNGVAGDTIQQGEALALRFFGSDVLGDVASGTEQTNPTTTAQGVTIEFDNIGNSEDLMVVLDLIDKDGADNILGGAGAADDNTEITRAVYIQNSDIYKSNTPGGIPSPYTGEFDIDNNDGLVIIESNDYNAANEDYEIQGVQIMQSGNGLTGQAIDLNKAIGDSGFSSTTSLVVWDGSDQDVIKIVDIGFIQSGSGTQEANLDFSYQIADGDLDVTGVQHIFANISNQWIV